MSSHFLSRGGFEQSQSRLWNTANPHITCHFGQSQMTVSHASPRIVSQSLRDFHFFLFFFYPRWGVSTSHQPVFQCNYSVSVTLNASKDVHMMKTSRAISRPDYSGRVSVIKAWLSDAMGHLGIVDVLYAQVGDKWNSASTCSAWHVCTRGERHCHPLCFCRMLFLVDCTHRWEITKHPYFVTVLKQIFQVSVLNRISFLATF